MPLHLTEKEQRAVRFAQLYGSDDPDLVKLELQALSREDAEEYLDKADLAYQDAREVRVKILNKQGQEMHMSNVTYEQPRVTQTDIIKKNDTIKLPVCFYCKSTAIASCLVEDSEIVLQLICGDHIRGEVIWRKEN